MSLLDRSGAGDTSIRMQFDLFDHSPFIDKFLEGVGKTYEQAVLEMTTLPFWLTFRGGVTDRMPGTDSLWMPMSAMHSGRSVKELSEMGKHVTSATERWHCAECIAEDISEGRLPYWRREHQLLTSFFCVKHEAPLRSSCPQCGAMTGASSHWGWGMLTSICACGADRRIEPNESVVIPELYRRLHKLGSDTLHAKIPQISWRDMQNMAVTVVRHHNPAWYSSHMQVLRDAFEGIAVRTSIFKLRPEGAFRQVHIATDTGASALRSPMLLALLDLTLDGAFERFAGILKKREQLLSKRSGTEDAEILAAREEFVLRREKALSGYFQMRSYWYLRIWDPDWLQSYFGKELTPIPTIEQDRRTVRRRIRENDPSFGPFSVVMYRLMVRDTELYHEMRACLKREPIPMQRHKNFAVIQAERESRLAMALDRVWNDEGMPQLITYQELGRLVGLSGGQAMRVILQSPKLSKIFSEHKDTFLERKIRWLVADEYEKRKALGKKVTAKAIGKRSGVRDKSRIVALLHHLIAALPGH